MINVPHYHTHNYTCIKVIVKVAIAIQVIAFVIIKAERPSVIAMDAVIIGQV